MSKSPNAGEATPAEMERAVGLFKVLAHPDRLRLACALDHGRVTTQKELVEEFGWPQSTAARHVAALRRAGLIRAERDGTEIRLSLGSPVALHLLQTVCEWVREDPRAAGGHPDPGTASTEPRVGPSLKAPSFRSVF
ncbi:MAG TPA: metalloregulator ArsR/SmtB family transcription factor [Longimicrobiales bacterium]|nr:metalloregulator ArsR/SmtB family transcription factor [Longimicrobiales bacterium]